MNHAVRTMSSIGHPLARIILGAALLGVPAGARAQDRDVAAAMPTECVAATGPDSGASAPDSAIRAAARRPAGDAQRQPTVRLFAAVRADEVRFDRQPRICVALRGDARLDSVRVIGRRNLSSPVVRGTTYRDVYVAVEVLGRLDADCISARITGAPRTGAAAEACASIGVRDSAAARRTGGPPP